MTTAEPVETPVGPDYGAAMRTLAALRSELGRMALPAEWNNFAPTLGEAFHVGLDALEGQVRAHVAYQTEDYALRKAWETGRNDPEYPRAMAILREHGIDIDPSYECPHDWYPTPEWSPQRRHCLFCGVIQ